MRRCPMCWEGVSDAQKTCHVCGACLCVSPAPKDDKKYTTCKKCGGKITRSKVTELLGRERMMRDE